MYALGAPIVYALVIIDIDDDGIKFRNYPTYGRCMLFVYRSIWFDTIRIDSIRFRLEKQLIFVYFHFLSFHRFFFLRPATSIVLIYFVFIHSFIFISSINFRRWNKRKTVANTGFVLSWKWLTNWFEFESQFITFIILIELGIITQKTDVFFPFFVVIRLILLCFLQFQVCNRKPINTKSNESK